MKTLISLLLSSLFLNFGVQAQHFDVGIFAGISNYQGDLVTTIPEGPEYKPAFGVFGRYNFGPRFSAKMNFYKGDIGGSDYYSTVKSLRRERNLSFNSPVYELGLQMEFNLLPYNIWINKNSTAPYFFIGVAGFYFNPQAELNGIVYDLQPLGTEGQGLPGYKTPYSLFSYAIPAGVGIKLSLNKKTNIGMEAGVRKTFTDYLDDVSDSYPEMSLLVETGGAIVAALSYRSPEYDFSYSLIDPSGKGRGNPEADDWYLFAGINLSINLGIKKKEAIRKAKSSPKRKPKISF